MLTPQQEELQIIEAKINNAIYALILVQGARLDNGIADIHCLNSIANSLIAIAKLMQLQAEQN